MKPLFRPGVGTPPPPVWQVVLDTAGVRSGTGRLPLGDYDAEMLARMEAELAEAVPFDGKPPGPPYDVLLAHGCGCYVGRRPCGAAPTTIAVGGFLLAYVAARMGWHPAGLGTLVLCERHAGNLDAMGADLPPALWRRQEARARWAMRELQAIPPLELRDVGGTFGVLPLDDRPAREYTWPPGSTFAHHEPWPTRPSR